MKRKLAILTIIIATSAFVTIVFGAPGAQDDPLVSKSYVDSKIAQISQAQGAATSDQIVEDVLARLEYTKAQSPSNATFTPVLVKSGQTIFGGEGAEMILRSGTAVIVAGGSNGIVNITLGVDLTSGKSVAKNNLLLIPRKDGRGLKATSDTWILARGGYELSN